MDRWSGFISHVLKCCDGSKDLRCEEQTREKRREAVNPPLPSLAPSPSSSLTLSHITVHTDPLDPPPPRLPAHQNLTRCHGNKHTPKNATCLKVAAEIVKLCHQSDGAPIRLSRGQKMAPPPGGDCHSRPSTFLVNRQLLLGVCPPITSVESLKRAALFRLLFFIQSQPQKVCLARVFAPFILPVSASPPFLEYFRPSIP